MISAPSFNDMNSPQLLKDDARTGSSNNKNNRRIPRSSSFHKAVAKAFLRGLQELKRSRHSSSSSSSNNNNNSSYISLHEDENCHPSPTAVPRGYLAVYVGDQNEHQRFIVRTEHLHHPVFRILLKKCEEEFGFRHNGPLFIPCQIDVFHLLLWHIENSNDLIFDSTQAQELVDLCLVSLADLHNNDCNR